MAKDLQANLSADLEELDREALKAEWEKTFGSSPPLYLSLAFMRTAIGYERQCWTFGGLSPATRRALASALAARAGWEGRAAQAAAASPVAAPGALLVREWNGRTYRVEVLDEGYCFDGRTWASLTAIAKRITGTNWSGPRFFGLTPKRGMKVGEG
ncbi:DUF2924 domain-containing protein [Defluviimonas sp. WL0075]|uniref:DUF2924 domain-containing protein n=1 Tax=Albidovulum sediminicola TaxID=2984331 RepID=A0ABT2YXG9_9RHOB|nr:DUF2924 domain-containing protein [Defluviimonas sp. WL0075]MCV2863525.1 DUF2924 domain-containing protein [Defluviimonas sp. WL0075]